MPLWDRCQQPSPKVPASNVRKINGVEITGTPNAGDVPVATDADSAAWASAASGGLLTDAVILAPGSSTRNRIQPTGNYTALTLRSASGQTAYLFIAEDDVGNDFIRFDSRWTTQGVSPIWVRTDPVGWVQGSGAITGATTAGIGVAGTASNALGIGVEGVTSSTGSGVRGISTSTGYGVFGESQSGASGFFQSRDASNAAATVITKQNGAGTAKLHEWQDSAGAALSYIDSLGQFNGTVVGGGGQETYDAIVAASGGDYTTVGAAIAASKYRLFIKNGTYTETGVELPNNTNLVLHGETTNGVILNYTAGSASSYALYGIASAGTASWNIRNITMKFSYATSASHYVWGNALTNSKIDSCAFIYNSATASKNMLYLNNTMGYNDAAPGNTVSRCLFDSTGIAANGCNQLKCDGWDVMHNAFTQDNTNGQHTAINVSGYRVTVIGNSMRFNYFGINSNAGNSVFSGNVMEGDTSKTYQCLASSGTGCVISNNFFRNAGQSNYVVYVTGGYSSISGNCFNTSGNLRALHLAGTADGSTVSGNQLYNGGANPALELASGADSVSIIGNNFNPTTTPLSDSGKGTVVCGNFGVNDYVKSANNAQRTWGQASELLTLSTAGATTDTTANLLPADSIIESVVVRVTTTITTATDWSVGDATTAARFAAANATMTAGATSVGLQHLQGSVATDAAGPVQTAAAKVRITTTGTPGAGAVRITVFYKTFGAPTS